MHLKRREISFEKIQIIQGEEILERRKSMEYELNILKDDIVKLNIREIHFEASKLREKEANDEKEMKSKDKEYAFKLKESKARGTITRLENIKSKEDEKRQKTEEMLLLIRKCRNCGHAPI